MKEWTHQCVLLYVSYGVSYRDAQALAAKHALTQQSKFGCDTCLWTHPQSMVGRTMQEWSMSV